ncbi:MAG: hypothetical protein ACLU30_01255 [Odoribacter splanchnicus]
MMYSIPKDHFCTRALKANRLCSYQYSGVGGISLFIVIVKYVWLEYTTDTAQRNATGFIVRFSGF